MRLLPVNPSAKSALTRVPLRLYVTAGVLLGALVAGYFLFVVPKNKAMADMRADTRSREETLQTFQLELARLDGARQRLDQLGRTLAAFEDRLPRQPEEWSGRGKRLPRCHWAGGGCEKRPCCAAV